MAENGAARDAAGPHRTDDGALARDAPRHQHVRRQRGRTEEQQREGDGHLLEPGQVLVERRIRRLLGSGQHLGGTEGVRFRRQRSECCSLIDPALQSNQHLVRPGSGDGLGQWLGGEHDAEVVRQGDDVLPAPRRPQILNRDHVARYLDSSPPLRSEHVDVITRDEPEVRGEVLLGGRPGAGRIATREHVEATNSRLGAILDPDDAAGQLGAVGHSE